MITNLPPPGGVSPHHHHHHHHHQPPPSSESSIPPSSQDSFSHYEDDFQPPQQQYPSHPQYQHQYYPQYPHQYPSPQQQPQVPHWHHQHGYYNPYPPQPQQPQSQQQTFPSYSPSDPSAGGYYPQSNGYYDQQHPNNGAVLPPGGQQSTHNCTPSPLANSDDSGGDCVNESKGSQVLRGGIMPLIPRPKGPRPTTSVMSAKRGGKRARQRDPNEPQKPVSAYALFFRDVQAGIKARNPAASFGEVSKHVAALWDGMDPDSKGAYKRRTEQAKKEYLRQLAAYRATLVSKGNTLESPYNGKGLDVTKVVEERNYLMSQRMTESSGYDSNASSLTPLGSAPTSSSSPQSTLGQSPPNNGYHLSSQHHLRHPAHMPSPDANSRYPGGSYQADPYASSQDDLPTMISNCKRHGCPNQVRLVSNSSRPMPEYCSNECLVNDKPLTNNPYASTTNNWPQQQQPEHGSSPSSNSDK